MLEQIRRDSEQLEGTSLVVGPFARLDANRVAATDGKTRGAITNLFGSQAAFQADTMARALSASDLIEQIDYPAPSDFPDADAWVDALFAAESARGPMHGGEPTVNDAFLWALWLSVMPYGLWSEQISRPSMEEYRRWLERLERVGGVPRRSRSPPSCAAPADSSGVGRPGPGPHQPRSGQIWAANPSTVDSWVRSPRVRRR